MRPPVEQGHLHMGTVSSTALRLASNAEQSTSFWSKDLGFIVTDSFDPSVQCRAACSTARKVLFLIRSIRLFLLFTGLPPPLAGIKFLLWKGTWNVSKGWPCLWWWHLTAAASKNLSGSWKFIDSKQTLSLNQQTDDNRSVLLIFWSNATLFRLNNIRQFFSLTFGQARTTSQLRFSVT